MVEVPITIACGNYDRTRALRDGRVKVEGCAATYLPLYPEEIFFRAFRYHEFDVSELSFSSYTRMVAAGTCDYVGIPAFVSRLFRHSGMYVRRSEEHTSELQSRENLVCRLRLGKKKYHGIFCAFRLREGDMGVGMYR